VPHKDGQRLGTQLKMRHVNTSALEAKGVDEAFALLAEAMYEQRYEQREARKPRTHESRAGARPPSQLPHTAFAGAFGGPPRAGERNGGSWLMDCLAACLPKPPPPPAQMAAQSSAPKRGRPKSCLAKCLPCGSGVSSAEERGWCRCFGGVACCAPKQHVAASAARARSRNEQRRKEMRATGAGYTHAL
jgi:hypothetical protein